MDDTVQHEKLEALLHCIENHESTPDEIQKALSAAFPDEDIMAMDEIGDVEDEPEEQDVEEPALDGEELSKEPAKEERTPAPARGRNRALDQYRQGSGPDDELVKGYMDSYSQFHILRSASQNSMVCTLLRTLVPAMARRMCTEAGVDGVSAMLLAEQAAEARVDEAFARALAGKELEEMHIGKAERLVRIADKHSRRMMTAIEKLHRLKRPRVNVKISGANNVNLGNQQVVTRPEGGEGTVVDAPLG